MHQYDTPLKEALQDGSDTLAAARDTRERLRRDTTPGDPERESELSATLHRIDRAMGPIRSHIGRLVNVVIPRKQEVTLRQLSHDLQYERRQLRKMLR